jgi:ABC-2 type transport system permease protein
MKIFWSFARQAFHSAAVYRFEFWMRLFWIYLLMYSVYWVWKTLYTQSPDAFGVSLEQMVTYAILGMLLDIVLDVGPEWYIANQVRTGAIDTDLMKPLDFHFHMLARSVGEVLFGLGILALPAFAMGYFLFDLQPPGDVSTSLLFAISIVFSFFVLFHVSFLIGALTVITLDIRNIAWAYYSLISFFSGQIVPLWLFPDFLRKISEVLPFQAIYYIPISIYIRTLKGSAAVQALGLQVFWAIVLAFISHWVWNRVHTRLTVQGG